MGDAAPAGWLALLAALVVPASLAAQHAVLGPLTRLAEMVVTVFAVIALASAAADPASSANAAAAILPYLAVPVIAAFLYLRQREGAALLVASAVLLATACLANEELRSVSYAVTCCEWLVLTTVAAGMARMQQHNLRSRPEQPQPYAEATRLLTQLRGVARQLPGATLDPGGIAEHLLEELQPTVPV